MAKREGRLRVDPGSATPPAEIAPFAGAPFAEMAVDAAPISVQIPMDLPVPVPRHRALEGLGVPLQKRPLSIPVPPFEPSTVALVPVRAPFLPRVAVHGSAVVLEPAAVGIVGSARIRTVGLAAVRIVGSERNSRRGAGYGRSGEESRKEDVAAHDRVLTPNEHVAPCMAAESSRATAASQRRDPVRGMVASHRESAALPASSIRASASFIATANSGLP
jgi:hypothetical protein